MPRPSSQPHVALLRGINVGGKNKLPMKELAALFGEIGCHDVTTYIQSGNVLFKASQSLLARVPGLIEKRIEGDYGYRIPIILRSASQLREVKRTNPYINAGANLSELYVAFLAALPKPQAVQSLDPDRSPPDEFAVCGSEIFLRVPNGAAKTKLTNAYFDSRLTTTSTVRNWNTLLKLVELTETV